MKKIKYLIFMIVVSFMFIPTCFAASASINVSSNKGTVVVGNNFNVTIKVNGSDPIGSWDYTVSYDSNVVKLVSGDLHVASYGDGKTKTATYNYTFKAIKTGSANISVKSAVVYDYRTEAELSPAIHGVTVKTLTQAELEATYSTNANLKSLSVEGYELTPSFSTDTLEYSLVVENEVGSVNIIANKADGTATVSGSGNKELVEGNNKVEIVVTAQKGNTKTYVINIERKELDPIYVEIDGKTLSLVRKAENLIQFNTYQPTTVTINDTEIPALYSEVTKYTLVGVKDLEGNVTTYIYSEGKYEKYIELSFSNIKLFPKKVSNGLIPDGYKKTTIEINDNKVEAYQLDKKSDFYLVYGVDVETNEMGLYQYDSKTNTLSRFDDAFQDYMNDRFEKLTYITILFGGLFLITFGIMVGFLIKNRKKKVVKEPIKEEKAKKNKKIEKSEE